MIKRAPLPGEFAVESGTERNADGSQALRYWLVYDAFFYFFRYEQDKYNLKTEFNHQLTRG